MAVLAGLGNHRNALACSCRFEALRRRLRRASLSSSSLLNSNRCLHHIAAREPVHCAIGFHQIDREFLGLRGLGP